MSYRILLVEDDVGTQARLRQLLELDLPEASLEVVESAEDALLALAGAQWDLAILDNMLSGISGLEALPRIRALYPSLPLLMLSGGARAPYERAALRAGADAYLEKNRAPEELVTLLRRLLTGVGRAVT